MPDFAVSKSTVVQSLLVRLVASDLEIGGIQTKSGSKHRVQFGLLGVSEFGDVATKVHVQVASRMAWARLRRDGREHQGGWW
jgi:hypothetical protein